MSYVLGLTHLNADEICMIARAVQISKESEDNRPIELILAVPRYPCRTFADRLRQYRLGCGWRQVDLVRPIGVDKDTVRNWEKGCANPRLVTMGPESSALIRAFVDPEGG